MIITDMYSNSNANPLGVAILIGTFDGGIASTAAIAVGSTAQETAIVGIAAFIAGSGSNFMNHAIYGNKH